MSILRSLLYNVIAPILRRRLGGKIIGKKIKGTDKILYYDRGQHLGFLFSREIVYEPEISQTLLEQVRSGDLVFEIGSNIGQYSIQLSEKLGQLGKLVCVEPDSDNFAFLSFNILKNKCTNVQLLNMAVSDLEDQMTFYKDTQTGGRMSSLIREYAGDHYEGNSETVKTITLKKMIEHHGTPAFVKVDVEGAEEKIFNDVLAISPSTVYLVEFREETKLKIYNMFKSLGFSIFLLGINQKEISSFEEIPGFGNLLIKFT